MLRMQEMAFPCFKFQKFSGGVWPHTRDHCYPPLINNDKLWLIFFLTFCAFFPSFISNTSIVSINFGANLDAQNAGNGIPVLQISKILWGSTPPDPPFMRGMLASHVTFSHCYPPLIYYLTERSLFKKCPPTGKSLKKALLGLLQFSLVRHSPIPTSASSTSSQCRC